MGGEPPGEATPEARFAGSEALPRSRSSATEPDHREV